MSVMVMGGDAFDKGKQRSPPMVGAMTTSGGGA
jgi:hypothetical protein